MSESVTMEPNLFKDPKARARPPRPKRRKGLLWVLLVVAVFFGVKGFLLGGGVEVLGRARALRELEIKTFREGILKELHVENAGRVKKGEVLFEFQNDGLGIELLHAIQEKETLSESLSQLEKVTEHSKKRLESAKVLFENGVLPRLKFEEEELGHSKNKAELSEAKRKLEEVSLRVKALQNQKDSLQVRAPLDGIFLGDLAKRKETYFREGEALGTVFNPSGFYLEAFLPETKSGRVNVGDGARVRFKAFNGSYQGKVAQVDEKATEEIEKVFKTKYVVRIKILMENFPEGLKPGMRGRAWILPRLKPAKKEALSETSQRAPMTFGASSNQKGGVHE